MKQLIFRLGSEPKISLKRFLIGLGLFVLSAALIGYGYFNHHFFQLAGLLVLPFALFFAIYGYLGIFANRFAQVLNNINPSDSDPS
jgi:hypothetical protein